MAVRTLGRRQIVRFFRLGRWVEAFDHYHQHIGTHFQDVSSMNRGDHCKWRAVEKCAGFGAEVFNNKTGYSRSDNCMASRDSLVVKYDVAIIGVPSNPCGLSRTEAKGHVVVPSDHIRD